MKQRILASILSLVMVLSLLPTAVWAESTPAPQAGEGGNTSETTTNGKLDLANGSIVITETGYTQGNAERETAYTGEYIISGTTTENTITVTGGDHQITLNGVNIDLSAQEEEDIPCAFAIEGGNVTVALADGTENTLKSGLIDDGTKGISCAGLWVGQNASLTITGNSGKLIAVGGGTGSHHFGNAAKAAGIGASRVYGSVYDTKYNTVGDITITGGVIDATGSAAKGYGGPGIGGGTNASTITISGGTITAKSGSGESGCAGIGNGFNQNGKKRIVINGGTVVATGRSAGIGGGAYLSAGTIEINGGNVTATSNGYGAGIGSGGGDYVSNGAKGGSITITGGTVTAQGGKYAAGIGGGGTTTKNTTRGGCASGNITITGGTVTATGGQNAPGIGSGSKSNDAASNAGCGEMETITISGGTITAVNGTGYSGTPYTLNDGTEAKSFGVGMGENPSKDAKSKFANWKLQTADGDAVELRAVSAPSNLNRNGRAYAPATLVIDGAGYYLLPEGCYNTGTGSAEVVIPSDAVTSTVTDLITALKNIDPNKGSFTSEEVEAVRGYAVTYNSLSESLQYYVDQQTEGHTLAEIQKAFEGKVDAKVTLKNGDETFDTQTLKYGEKYDLSGIVPTKANYTFDGWYLGDELLTSGDSWPYLSDTTLEAKWVSEITGDGTQEKPYIIKSGANLVALSHISLYGLGSVSGKNIYAGTEEEFALFGKDGVSDANRAALMLAYYKLDRDIELTTAGKFYGILNFRGHFNGNNKNIALNIDNCDVVVKSDLDENNNDIAVGASKKRGKLELNVGGDTAYIEINAGIFNSATGATIENFTTSGSVKVLMNTASTGVVVGIANGCTIKDITNKASLEHGATDNTAWASGIVGTVSTNATTFENCHNEGAITSGTFGVSIGNSAAAGICSYQNASATFTNCSNSGELFATRHTEASGRRSNVGGIVGLASGAGTTTFTNCKNTGNMRSQAETNNAAAGIVVVNGSNTSVVLNSCVNAATLYAKLGYAGALVSYRNGPSGMPTSATYTDCVHIMSGADASGYKVGNVAAAAGESGNFTIRVPVESNADNFYSADRYVIDGSGAKVADIASANYHYIYNDFTHNDNILEKNYPFQTEETAYVISSTEDYTNLVMAIRGDLAAQNAVLGNLFAGHDAEAKALALSNIYVKLNNNITLSDLNVIGLGTDRHPFGGTILGQNHTVTYALSSDALSVEQSSKVGFIGVSNGATVQDLSFAGNVNVQIDPENGNNVYFGAAVVDGSGATVKNCHSKVNYTVSRTTTVKNATGGYLKAGGLLGAQASATVEDSSYKGTIAVTSPKYARAGGIAAEIGGTVKNCKVEGDVSATLEYDAALPVFGEDSHAGGIAGAITSASTIENCMAVGSVTAKNTVSGNAVSKDYGYAYAGGLLGNSTADVTVKDCNALTTETAIASRGDANQFAGAFVGKEDKTLTLSGTNWYVKTATVSVSDGAANAIDTTVLNGKTFGDTATMEVPEGVTMVSDYASLAGSTVSFIKAGDSGEVKLVYNGQTFYTATVNVTPKSLTDSNVTVTGVNDKYSSDSAAAEATLNVIHNGKELVKDTDYTVTQDTTNHKFTITFKGNYSGSVERTYVVASDILEVTALDYNGTYDGKNHSITVNAPEGATVKYGESAGTYDQNSVVKKDAGTYVVYWKATKDSQTVSGSAVINIAKAPLTIKADDMSMTVGGTLPKFTYTSTGLVNGDSLATEPKLACTADGSVAGTYSVIPSGADAGSNYEITYVNGALTIYSRSSGGGSSSSSGRSYAVSAPSAKNGDVTVSPKNASKGTTVTINAKPDAGYVLGSLEVKDANGNTLSLTDKGNGKYTFTMPASKVEIKATFVKEVETSPFSDVSTSAYYYEAVKWAQEKGITGGIGNGLFGPNQPCTRAQIVTFLWRAAGSPEPKAMSSFADVSTDAYYAKAVAWAVENGITTGTGDGKFSPDATCNRAQSVTFLFRAIGKLVDSKAEFSDVLTDSYYANAVAWAVENGVTNGIGDGLFGPDNSCTRAQIVTFLFRAYQGK